MKWLKISVLLALCLCGLSETLSAAQPVQPVPRSVCLLKSPRGSGSGFFARWEGMDVLITNNHVILELPDVEILDVNGKKYPYEVIYSARDRDLAIIPIHRSNHADMPDLPIMKNPDTLQVDTKVTAYGDSLGAGVIVAAKGHFLGIGPKIVEVSAPFVSGNSGGPVLENKTAQVIGAATFCRIIRKSRSSSMHSRFEADAYRPAIRRFATRIDNLPLSSMEKITLADLRQDQHRAGKLNQTYAQVSRLLDGSAPPATLLPRLRMLLQDDLPMPGLQHSTYLRQETRKKWELLTLLRNLLAGKNVAAPTASIDPQLQEAWQKILPSVQFVKMPPVTCTCPVCHGFGKKRDGQRSLSAPQEKCQSCRGTGKYILRPEEKYARLPQNTVDVFQKLLQPEKKDFCGFKVGVPVTLPTPDMKKFYRRMKAVPKGVFTVYRIAGNHLIPEAAETRLWLFGNILMQIDIILPAADPQQKNSIREKLLREYPDLQQAHIRQIPRSKCRDKHLPIRNIHDLRHFSAACQQDPFGLFYFLDTQGAQARETAPFLQISFRHNMMDGCRKLIHLQPRRPEPAAPAGAKKKSMFYTGQ